MRLLTSLVSLPGRHSWSTATSRRWNSSGGVTWLWKANKYYEGFFEANRVGSRSGYGEITLNSTKPIEREHVQEALKHLQRKVPTLRTLLKPRDGQIWFCQPHEVGLDFEVLSTDASLGEEMTRLNDEGFHDGYSVPWKARLVPRSFDTPCKVEGLKEKFPYQYDFALMIHHGVADGHEVLYCLNGLHKILDNLLSGQSVGEEKPADYGDYREIDDELLSDRMERLLRDKKYFEFIKNTVPSLDSIPTILQAFPRPIEAKSSTNHVRKSINLHTLRTLQAKCSTMGVGFSSFCVAVANIAVLEAIKETSMIKDSYKIGSVIFVNSRRYMKTKTHVHGCFVTLLSYFSHVKINALDSFWDYCKMVDQELKSNLKQGRSLDQKIVRDIIEADYPPFNYTDNLKPALHDSSITYMGNIAETMPMVGQHIQVSNITSVNFIHKFINSFMHEILVFRGNVQYTFTYATDYFTEETASLLVDKFFMVLHILSKH